MQNRTGFIVIGVIGPIGCDKDRVISSIETDAASYGLKIHRITVNGFLKTFQKKITATGKAERLRQKIEAMNDVRKKTKEPGIFSTYAISEIKKVISNTNFSDTVFVVDQIKRQEEAKILIQTYQSLYFQIGIHSSETARLTRLRADGRESKSKYLELFEIDDNEQNDFGQRVIKTFHLSHYFVNEIAASDDIRRFFRLIYNHPFETPTPDEHFMYLAFATATRSGDLSRQVGACLVSENYDLLATGANDVPKYGGGLYCFNTHAD